MESSEVEIKNEPVLDLDDNSTNGAPSQSNCKSVENKTEPMDVVFNITEVAEAREVKNEPELLIDDTSNHTPDSDRRRTSKRHRNEESWKRNIMKTKREKGEAYLSPFKNQLVPAKCVRPEKCRTNRCPLKCSKNFTAKDRETVHKAFWTLSTQDKQNYYCENVVRLKPERGNKIKFNTYWYLLDKGGVSTRVCKSFFCNTLAISQSTLTYHAKHIRNTESNTARQSLQGRHRKRFVSAEKLNEVKGYIDRLPREPSVYFGTDNTKSCFRRDIKSLTHMYTLYLQYSESPVRYHTFGQTLNKNPNVGFYTSMHNDCLKCLAYERMKKKSEKAIAELDEHLVQMQQAVDEKAKDLESTAQDPNAAVLSFSLDTVFYLPENNANVMFHSRKWCTYNLMAKSNKGKVVYNAMWHEGQAGLSAEAIASVLVKVLTVFLTDNPHLEHLCVWSKGYELTRHSVISASLTNFLRQPESRKLRSIMHKFWVLGHSATTELDGSAATLAKIGRGVAIGSHAALMKIIEFQPKSTSLEFKNLNMEKEDFKAFKQLTSMFDFSALPIDKVCCLAYSLYTFNIDYKCNFDDETTTYELVVNRAFAKLAVHTIEQVVQPTMVEAPFDIDKVKDIVSLYGCMESWDIEFYNSLDQFQRLFETDVRVKDAAEHKLREKYQEEKERKERLRDNREKKGKQKRSKV